MIGEVIALVLFVALGAVASWKLWCSEPSDDEEEEHTMAWHHCYGTCRVRYPDGKTSQPMSRRCAMDYQELFGGSIIPR